MVQIMGYQREGARRQEMETEREDMGRNRTDVKKFGSFVTELRRERGLTQKQLAEKLYVSNKAVSKWETGLGMPDISMLEPLAESLGVSVSELLRGERETPDWSNVEKLTDAELCRLLKRTPELTEQEKEELKQVKKKRAKWYFLGLGLSAAEMALLFAFGEKLGISLFDRLLDMLTTIPMVLFLGIWPFFFMQERLPLLYDKIRISTYSDGCFRFEMAGMAFNNRNWPHITKALRTFCFLMPVCWPAAYVLLRLLMPDFLWLFGRIPVLLVLTLGGLFIPVAVVGKKYE